MCAGRDKSEMDGDSRRFEVRLRKSRVGEDIKALGETAGGSAGRPGGDREFTEFDFIIA